MPKISVIVENESEIDKRTGQFDTSTWAAGIYLVRATNSTQTISKKITIN